MVRIIRHLADIADAAKGSVLVLGNFDGVHRGHQGLIREAVSIAKSEQRPMMLMSFYPHPLTKLKPEQPLLLLNNQLRDKISHLDQLGVDYVLMLHFQEKLMQLSAIDFIEQILVKGLRVSHMVVGHDFIFGHKRSGNAALLQSKAAHYGYQLTQLAAIASDQQEIFSSSMIRAALVAGDIEKANHMLGYSYTVTGRVIKGFQRGRELGFPTANIALKGNQFPRFGVYQVRVQLLDMPESPLLLGIANMGIKPTVGGKTPLLEVHIPGQQLDLYGRNISVRFEYFIRPEMRFADLEALKAQIAQDLTQLRS